MRSNPVPWLNPQPRCNVCLTALPEPPPAVCPKCSTDLSGELLRSDMRDWAETRKRGWTRFMWSQVLRWTLVGLVLNWSNLRQDSADPGLWVLVALGPISGYTLARSWWRGAERQYATWMEQTSRA